MGNVTLPNGSTFQIVSTYGSSTPITAISNNTVPLVTATHSLSAGDIVEISSGWNRLNNGLYKVGSVTGTTAFSLLGVDTSNTGNFMAGQGIGSFRKVTGLVLMQDLTDLNQSGGDWQKAKYQPLDGEIEVQYRTVRNPFTCSFKLGHPIPTPLLALLTAADSDNLQRGFVFTSKDGSTQMFSATVDLELVPDYKANERRTRKVDLLATSIPYVL